MSVLVLYLFLFLACTCSFVIFPRVFASSESKSPPLPRGLDCSVLCDGCACEEIEQSINETCMHKSKYYIYKLIIHGLKYMCMYRHTYIRLHYLTFRHVRLHNKTKHNIRNHT